MGQGGSTDWMPPSMADAPYLICLALLEQEGARAMPINGKSLRQAIAPDAEPSEEGRTLALEWLVRLWQRSDTGGPQQRTAADDSLLLLELPFEALQQDLPRIKAIWIADGDTASLLDRLHSQADGRIWRLTLERHQPLRFSLLER